MEKGVLHDNKSDPQGVCMGPKSAVASDKNPKILMVKTSDQTTFMYFSRT